jgi:hypothetical protein
MKILDKVKLLGGILISKNDEEPIFIQNIVCRIGRERAASHLANSMLTFPLFSYLGVGSGILPASTEDLSLADEFYRVKLDTVWAVNYTLFGSVDITGLLIDAYVGVGPGIGEYTISEWGLLNKDTNGDLICHQTPDYQFTITGDDKLSVLWGVTVT